MADITDLDVWRAARQIVSNHPEDPEQAAWQQADAAWEEGDMSALQKWMRIAEAVSELIRAKPHAHEAIN